LKLPHIRLRYAGLISFSARIIGVFTGLLFITIVTRQLPEEEFGVWVWITRLVGYVIFPVASVSYWVTRYVARDLKVARTGLYLTLIMALIASLAYVAISPLAAQISNAPLIFFIIASVQVPLAYLKENFDSVGSGLKPQVTSYGFLAFEATKVVFAFMLMTLLGPSLVSAIISVAIAQLVNIITLYIFIRNDLDGGFDRQLAGRWLRASWIPLYTGFSAFILLPLDASLVIGLSESSLILAYYGAAYMLYSSILLASALSSALYPKLLAGGGGRDIEEILRLTLMFADSQTPTLCLEPCLRGRGSCGPRADPLLLPNGLDEYLGLHLDRDREGGIEPRV